MPSFFYLFAFLLLSFDLFSEIISQDKNSKKIVLLTIPKSGTHLLKKAVELITEKEVGWIRPEDVYCFDPKKHLPKDKDIYIQHLFEEFDVLNTSKYNKIILVRDPRDVLISQIDWLKTTKSWWMPMEEIEAFTALSEDEQLSYVINFPENYVGIRYFVRQALVYMNDPNVFVCRFEDLVGPEGGADQRVQVQTLQNLADHMGYTLSWEEAEAIASKLFGDTLTFRQGRIGLWKDFLNLIIANY